MLKLAFVLFFTLAQSSKLDEIASILFSPFEDENILLDPSEHQFLPDSSDDPRLYDQNLDDTIIVDSVQVDQDREIHKRRRVWYRISIEKIIKTMQKLWDRPLAQTRPQYKRVLLFIRLLSEPSAIKLFLEFQAGSITKMDQMVTRVADEPDILRPYLEKGSSSEFNQEEISALLQLKHKGLLRSLYAALSFPDFKQTARLVLKEIRNMQLTKSDSGLKATKDPRLILIREMMGLENLTNFFEARNIFCKEGMEQFVAKDESVLISLINPYFTEKSPFTVGELEQVLSLPYDTLTDVYEWLQFPDYKINLRKLLATL